MGVSFGMLEGEGDPRKQSVPKPSGSDLLADVLAGEHLPARLALEAAQMPLFVQRQQRLPILNVPSTASTVWKRRATHSYRHSPCKSQGR